MRTRLKDVAERVSLSPALVSGVLNGRSNVWASEETRARVHKAALDLNYHPSNAAKALSAGKTKVVALVYRRLPGTCYRLAYTGLVDAFSEELQSRGYNLTVATFSTGDEVLDHLRMLANSHACDAVILWGREADTEPQGELLDSLGIPFVVKGRHEARHPEWRQIDFDHEWMTSTALEAVVSLGHRRVAYIGFPHDEAYVHGLRRGFVGAHRRLFGAEPDHMIACEDEIGATARAIDACLEGPDPPTAFVAAAGNYAWHALEACLARRGKALSAGPGGYAAAGIVSYSFALTFGEAMVFQGVEIDNLALHMSPGLLDSVLGGEACENVNRFRPALSPAPSVGLSFAPERTPLESASEPYVKNLINERFRVKSSYNDAKRLATRTIIRTSLPLAEGSASGLIEEP